MDKIITAKDVAVRDSQPSVSEWIRITSIQLKMRGICPVIFDSQVRGKTVPAYISNGRWMALCDETGCQGCEYVDPDEPIFYCLSCGNGQTGQARPVKFPSRRREIEAALLERAMVPSGGNDVVTRAFNARPLDEALRRDWVPEDLKNHPGLFGRVIITTYGESSEMIRAKTREVRNAGHL